MAFRRPLALHPLVIAFVLVSCLAGAATAQQTGQLTGVRLTATPRCGFPDRRLEAALRTGLFERIHVRFYGNDTCSLGKGGTYGVVGQWEKWTAAFPRTQVYLGLAPAESGVPEGAQGTVAVYLKYLYYDLLPKVQKANNYGGVMVWDRFADKKTRWSSVVNGWA
ncbi:Xylanase inhibitor protein 1 [Triticum urartu]|uniref:Xylanase inhibitor protein 1 n=1 Tax=Triticum urartu TaxID=4572 RepID=M7ZW70_TRIUA|nr:Xylanase inhibitor protein 1 [Triticum urartu]